MLNLVIEAQSNEWPNGLACKVVKQLQEKYHLSDTMSLVDKRIELNKIKIGKNEHPKKLFNCIKAVETRFNTKTKKIKEKYKMVVVIS